MHRSNWTFVVLPALIVTRRVTWPFDGFLNVSVYVPGASATSPNGVWPSRWPPS